jgi:hypothetical protein
MNKIYTCIGECTKVQDPNGLTYRLSNCLYGGIVTCVTCGRDISYYYEMRYPYGDTFTSERKEIIEIRNKISGLKEKMQELYEKIGYQRE